MRVGWSSACLYWCVIVWSCRAVYFMEICCGRNGLQDGRGPELTIEIEMGFSIHLYKKKSHTSQLNVGKVVS